MIWITRMESSKWLRYNFRQDAASALSCLLFTPATLSTAFRADSLRPLFSVPSSFFNFFLKTCSSSSPQTGWISISHLSYESQQYYAITTVTTPYFRVLQSSKWMTQLFSIVSDPNTVRWYHFHHNLTPNPTSSSLSEISLSSATVRSAAAATRGLEGPQIHRYLVVDVSWFGKSPYG